jgi:hypothetical protein
MPEPFRPHTPKLEALVEFERHGYDIVKRNLPNYQDYAYVGSSTISKQYRGHGLRESLLISFIKLLCESRDKKGIFVHTVVSSSLVKLRMWHPSLLGIVDFQKFSSNGVKVFKDIKPNIYHLDGIPSSYVLKIDYSKDMGERDFSDLY